MSSVVEVECFCIKVFVTIESLTSSAVSLSEIASLDHEVFNDPVELASFVALTFWFFSKFFEILCGFWNSFSKQTDYNAPNIFVTYSDVEPNLKIVLYNLKKLKIKILIPDLPYQLLLVLF